MSEDNNEKRKFINSLDDLFKDIITLNYKILENIRLTREEERKIGYLKQCVELYNALLENNKKEKTSEDELFNIDLDKEVNEVYEKTMRDLDTGESLSEIFDQPTVKPPPDTYTTTGKEIVVVDNTETKVETPKEITYDNDEGLKEIMLNNLMLFKEHTEKDLIKLKGISDLFW